ncbi:MAG: DNA polymerase zeta [Claussenomyces sp. TS43310]|nr:MAG: DNA polymerase zeta [Claussenomyces sp. TS43310]
MELFRVRLNCIDHYQSSPTQFDPQLRRDVVPSQRYKEPEVPVIRVFGSTETGQKVCAHIHGAFPYLYIEYDGDPKPEDIGVYIHRLHLSIDHALGVSYRRNVYDGKNSFVARITLVKGVPFYGFAVGYRYFLKIYMLNPTHMIRLADLLRQGVVMRKIFQPFEAHLQYLLQWMADYNLYGCSYIDCSKAVFRPPVPRYEELDNLTHLWHDRSIPRACLLQDGVLPRVSHCSIEVDICVRDILNRKDIKPRPLHHDFVERLNLVEPDGRLVYSMEGLWRDETRRRKSRMANPDPGSSPFPPEVMISMSADARDSQRGGWIHESEYMAKVNELIDEERIKSNQKEISFDNFVEKDHLVLGVKTALEAVEDLYPENLARALGIQHEMPQLAMRFDPKAEDLEVDERRITSFDIGEDEDEDEDAFPFESDEEVLEAMKLSQRERNAQPLQRDANIASADCLVDGTDDGIRDGRDSFTEKLKDADIPSQSLSTTSLDATTIGNNDHSNSDPDGPGSDVTIEKDDGKADILSSHRYNAPLAPKRTRPDERRTRSYNKRQRIDAGESLSSRHEDRENSSQIPNKQVGQTAKYKYYKHLSSSSAPPTVNGIVRKGLTPVPPEESSQGKSLKVGAGNLASFGFPVVKDPHEPSTVYRLSQSTQASQKSDSASSKKLISFQATSPSSQEQVIPNATRGSSETSELTPAFKGLLDVLDNLRAKFPHAENSQTFAIAKIPLAAVDVVGSMSDYGLMPIIYQDSYYSNEADVPDRPREWAGREFKLESQTVPYLPEFDPSGSSAATFGEKASIVLDKIKEEAGFIRRRRACKLRSWEIGESPPSYSEVASWSRAEATETDSDGPQTSTARPRPSECSNTKKKLSQVDGPTQINRYGFKYTQKEKATSVRYETQYMSTMSLEVHVNSRGTFVPNPEEDEVQFVVWCLQSDEEGLISNGVREGTHVGIVVLSEDENIAQKIARQSGVEVRRETSELDVLLRMVEIVRTYDPDILTGYEVHSTSWGFLIERARLKYDYNLCDEFSRMRAQSYGRFGKENDKWGFNNTSTIRITGRHMINIWRAMRSELNLLQYTMENVVFHILHLRIPHYAWRDLTLWYTNGKPNDLAKVVDYFVSRVQLDLEILEENEIIPRTSEQARLLGVDFFSVFSRGSQFKVESLMFRIAKAEDFLLVSPSRKQVGGQNALECLPLVMEPQSAFYNSPLLVLDFQSLYPSVMIAYNYCYSTFLGRVVNWRGTNKMGFSEYKRQARLLELLKDHINIAPNGIMYVRPEIRKSLLAKMLGEILETRVMVKSGMKIDKDDRTLQRLLNNRQLALKLIANVTYGYTSASFSGRMPCSEIADSIVQTGRETLEKAIALIHSVKRWGAEVVYGDTDSLFVYLKGRSKDQAFDIGREIADTITNMNPRPVKLKFEKVYHPCVLLAKKRYVGFKYESREQEVPEFDAKGIETVRRDGTPAEQKMEEKALKILFRSADLSQVKEYFQSQCEKIMKGSVSIQDFCFAKEVKLGTYSERGLPPPGALISTKRMLEDHRAEPQYGERVPYVVITGAPGARLIDRCVAPETLLHSDHSELDAEYYISKNLIPPLERIFNLVGANVRQWYDEMPKIQRVRRVETGFRALGSSKDLPLNKKTLESYMKLSSCLVCKGKLEADGSFCTKCLANTPASLFSLQTRLSAVEKKAADLEAVCRSCSRFAWADEVRCDSMDCPVFYTRTRQRARLATEQAIVKPAMMLLQGTDVDREKLVW